MGGGTRQSGGLDVGRVAEGKSRALTGSHFSQGAGGWGLPRTKTWAEGGEEVSLKALVFLVC